jgi:hypothetical protein
MNNMRTVPKIYDRKNVGLDAFLTGDVVDQVLEQALQASRAPLEALAVRYETACATIRRAKPTEKIPAFVPIGSDGKGFKEIEAIERAATTLVERLEIRAAELERERIANLPEVEARVEDLEGWVRALLNRVAVLEGRQSDVRVGSPRASHSVTPMVMALEGGAGGLARPPASPPGATPGAVRKIG